MRPRVCAAYAHSITTHVHETQLLKAAFQSCHRPAPSKSCSFGSDGHYQIDLAIFVAVALAKRESRHAKPPRPRLPCCCRFRPCSRQATVPSSESTRRPAGSFSSEHGRWQGQRVTFRLQDQLRVIACCRVCTCYPVNRQGSLQSSASRGMLTPPGPDKTSSYDGCARNRLHNQPNAN